MPALVAALFGFVFGFVGSMPVAGPIAVLLVMRALDGRFRSASLIGIGSVLPETVYASLAFWGFATFLAQHPWMVPVSHAGAATILLGLGVSLLRRRSEPRPDLDAQRAGANSFTLGLLVSALNPSVIVAWTGATTMLFSTGWVEFQPGLALPFGLGAGAGILGWYVVLIGLLRRHKDRFSRRVLRRVLRGFGVLVLGLAVWFLWRLAAGI